MMDDRPRYQHFFRCRTCGGRFSVLRLTDDPAKVKTPPCPKKKCGGKVRQSNMPDIGMDVAAGKAPAQVGAIPVRAHDMAMEIAMQDAGATDINDRAREGESAAPKLPHHLQQKADNFWGAGKKAQPTPGRMMNMKADLSSIFGERAQVDPSAVRFTADKGAAIQPILQAPGKRPGDSAVPHATIIADYASGAR